MANHRAPSSQPVTKATTKGVVLYLEDKGISQTEIARICGVSRQRVGQILHPGSHKARELVSEMVRAGKLPRAETAVCKICGAQAEEYDHRDYKKPIDVVPVCHKCNCSVGRGANQDYVPDRRLDPNRYAGCPMEKVAKDVSIHDLADKLGIGAGYLHCILTLKQRPGAKLALAICKEVKRIKPSDLRPDLFK